MSMRYENSEAEVALQYNDGYSENIISFANNINTTEGGTHEVGFKSALTKVINDYARKYKFLKDNDDNLRGEDVREGLSCVISVKVTEAQFEGQTKTKLGNSEMRSIVEKMVNEKLSEFFEENPAVAKIIVDKSLTASRAREAAKRARENTRRKARSKAHPFRVSLRIVPTRITPIPRYISSREIRRAARQSKAATDGFRLSFRFGEKC